MAYEININNSSIQTLSSSDLDKAHIVENEDGSYNMLLEDKSIRIEIISLSEDKKRAQLRIDNQIYSYEIKTPLDQLVDKMGFSIEEEEDETELNSPMPGIILSIEVNVGDEVEADSPLLILEAMKMENVIKAKSTRIVKEVHIEVGQAVNKNDLLISFE